MNHRELDKIVKKRKISFFPDDYASGREVKSNDIQFSTVLDTTAMAGFQALLHLNGLGTGINANQRNGRVVAPRSIWLTACVYLPDNTNGTTVQQPYQNQYKLSLVWDRYPNAAPPPGAVALTGNAWWFNNAKLFQNQSGVPSNILSMPNVDLRDRCTILWQDQFDLVVNQRETHFFEAKVDLAGFKQVFNSGNSVTITDIQEGALYLCIQTLRIGSQGQARFDCTGRYFYEDA